MRKKIAILSLHLGYGGVERATTSLANSLAKLDKYDIDINNAANGIPLGNPRPHNLTHNRAFHEKVSSRLRSVETNIVK